MYRSKAIIVIFVSVLLLAGEAAADFKQCVGPCFIGCVFDSDKFACGSKCLVKCIIDEAKHASADVICRIRCAVDRCAKLVGDIHKVTDCVKECETVSCSIASSPLAEETYHQLELNEMLLN